MSETNYNMLDILNIKDIQVACKHADIEVLLKPIRERPDFYKKYVKQLGSSRPDKKSSIVKLYMPKIAFDLYQKGDEAYIGIMVIILGNFKSNFEKALTECIEPPVSNQQLKEYNVSQLVELYFKVVDVSVTDVPVDLYFMMLKLHGIILDEAKISEIELQIKQIEEHNKQLADAVTNAEKQVEQKYTQEISQLLKEKKELEKKYTEIKKQNRDLAAELEGIKEQLEKQKDDLTRKWQAEFDKKNSQRQAEEDKEFKSLHEKRQRDLAVELAEEEAQKREKLQERVKQEEQQLQAQFEQKKSELDNIIEGLLLELQNNTDRKDQLESELQLLQEEIKRLQEFMERLKAYEKDYFDNFEQHIIQNKVDSILLDRFGSGAVESISTSSGTSIVSPAGTLKKETEETNVTDNAIDLFDDLCDNISVYFDESSEITSVIVAAILNNKALIVTDDVASYLASCISALIDAKTPLVVESGKQKDDVDKIIKIINDSDSKVIYLPGILDDYDEICFSIVCRQCCGKVLIAGVATMEHLAMMSGSINNYAVIMDINNYVHFDKGQALWIGQYFLENIIVEYDKSKCKEYYSKYFRGLVHNQIITKKTALDFSSILGVYFEFMQEQIGDVFKAAVSKAFDYKINENADAIIEKSEFHIG